MQEKRSLKDMVVKEIESLPEDQLQEVLKFVDHLRTKKNRRPDERPAQEIAQVRDPLAEYIGGVSQGSLAQNIDDELYNR